MGEGARVPFTLEAGIDIGLATREGVSVGERTRCCTAGAGV